MMTNRQIQQNPTEEKPGLVQKLGFTLIELSIVLVIIGLIVGGVLVGQDLIKAAEIRASVAQIEKYNTAVNTFQGKFGGIPGDLAAAQASAFSLYTASGDSGRGDNNGLIDGTVASPSAWGQESGMFWVHLSQANLVDGSYILAWDAAAPVALVAASVPGTLPLSRIGRGNYITVSSASGLNYYLVGGISAAGADGSITTSTNLTPIEAYNMDVKMDDGAPLTGGVQVHATGGSSITAFVDAPSSDATSAVGKCVVGDTAGTALTNTYNRSLTGGGSSPACIARFRFN